MSKWITKDKKAIPYKKLTDSHLLSILLLIKRKAKEGVTICNGGGLSAEDIWYDEYTIHGKKVKKMFDYKGLLKEAKRRGIK